MVKTLLLLTGIPATGKTTLGHVLETSYGYRHFDREDFADWPRWQRRLWNRHLSWFVKLMKWWYGKVVITWGFSPIHDKDVIDDLIAQGFTWVWFDGNREAALQKYLARNRGTKFSFVRQLAGLNRFDFQQLAAHSYDPFTQEGEFKPIETQITELKTLIRSL